MLVRSVCLFVAVVFIILGANVRTLEAARQKRCIVVQKQSGSRDADDDDEDYRQPQPKDPRPDRFRADGALKRADVEDIPAKLLKLNGKPRWLTNRLMLRNKTVRDNLNKDLSPYYLP